MSELCSSDGGFGLESHGGAESSSLSSHINETLNIHSFVVLGCELNGYTFVADPVTPGSYHHRRKEPFLNKPL